MGTGIADKGTDNTTMGTGIAVNRQVGQPCIGALLRVCIVRTVTRHVGTHSASQSPLQLSTGHGRCGGRFRCDRPSLRLILLLQRSLGYNCELQHIRSSFSLVDSSRHSATADALLALALLPARYDVPTTHEQQEILCKNSYTAQHPTHASTRTHTRTHSHQHRYILPTGEEAGSVVEWAIGKIDRNHPRPARRAHADIPYFPLSTSDIEGCHGVPQNVPPRAVTHTMPTCSVHLSHNMQRTPVVQHAPP